MLTIEFNRWPNRTRTSFRCEILLKMRKHWRRFSICRWPTIYGDSKIHLTWSKFDRGLGFSNQEAMLLAASAYKNA